MNIRVIKSMKDANKLINLGNHLLGMDRDRNNRRYLVFLFEDTEKFRIDLKSISK